MTLHRFLRPLSKDSVDSLTDDKGSNQPWPTLCKEVHSEVCCLVEAKAEKKRGPYLKISAKEKAMIGRYASVNGVASAVHKFKDKNLKESSVRDWRNAYVKELQDKRKTAKLGEELIVDALPSKKRGRPVLLGEKLDKHLQQLIITMRTRGTPIGTSVVIGIGQGILMKYKSNCSDIKLNKEWARSVLRRMGFTKRRANSKSKFLPDDFEKIKEQFLTDVQSVIHMEEVPPSLVLNWDHTAMKIVPSSQWTMEKKGTKRVEIVAVDDKRQITAVFACSMSGKFLPMQLIYKGTTNRCLPKDVKFPSDWHVTHTENHWANEITTVAYLRNVIIPYVKNEREILGLQDDHCALALFDVFKGQCTAQVLKILEENHIFFVTIPNNCTDRLQPLDLSVNKPAKDFVRNKFREWYGGEICKQLEEGVNEDVDMRISNMKPLTAHWIMELYHYLVSRPSIIINGFKAAGIKNCH